MVAFSRIAVAASVLLTSIVAHPGEEHDPEVAKREVALRRHVAFNNRRALNACAGSAADVALKQRAIQRRDAKLKELRQKRSISADAPIRRRAEEDLSTWAAVDHASSEGYTLDTDPATLFAQNATCVIVPETTIGPYWVAGELIRTEMTDGQSGVPLHLDVQFVDVSTCAGVPEILVDAWHCNATGVYSGVSATGQGGLNSTFGRGVQQTDDDGVVQFDTMFPGHYTGRATHIHVKTTSGATVLDNNTYVDGTTNHVGQLFFDQSLISEVEAVTPYSTNQQELTLNSADSIAFDEATEDYDPFVQYVLLGDDISQGILAWITVGINTTADYSSSASAAAHYYAGGGVDTSSGNSGGGPGGAGGPPSGFPSGAAPSGAPPASSASSPAVSSTPSTSAGSSCKKRKAKRH
ncbi:putative extracellular dioxygenase [Colletotrichum musicola]|uniref:Putative extracellular dioxygenase n=1 Tax=Colletotrichum musicola TaxID=2175873 RepID=A0A8H6JB13_9PEZI|nr:putative extracellular dioxygenase [Colletotrichum musicola]